MKNIFLSLLGFYKKYIKGEQRYTVYKSPEGAKKYVESRKPIDKSEAISMYRY